MQGEVRQINGKRVATPEYRSWQMMKNRCLNPKARDYAYYGGRGIKVCQRWLRYDAFLADMGRKPTPAHTLERKRVHGNYCPSNCIWATRTTQARNRTSCTARAWELAEALGIKQTTAAHMIGQVRAKDRGVTHYFELSPERERIIRKHLERINERTV